LIVGKSANHKEDAESNIEDALRIDVLCKSLGRS